MVQCCCWKFTCVLLQGKLVCASSTSKCNVVAGNVLVLMVEGNISSAKFTSGCNVVIDGNTSRTLKKMQSML